MRHCNPNVDSSPYANRAECKMCPALQLVKGDDKADESEQAAVGVERREATLVLSLFYSGVQVA